MKNKLRLSWILSLSLTTINIAFILLFLFHGSHHSSDSCQPKEIKNSCLMHHELNLDSNQKIVYDSIKSSYQAKAQIYVDSLRYFRETLMTELNKVQVDSIQLNQTIESIHQYNKIVFTQLIEQYFAIKRILNINQQEKLCSIYCDIFGCSSPSQCKMKNSHCKKNNNGSCCPKEE